VTVIEPLSFPKIISGRIGDAAQPRSKWRQWRQIVGRLDATVGGQGATSI
jgi:hypothetical protein